MSNVDKVAVVLERVSGGRISMLEARSLARQLIAALGLRAEPVRDVTGREVDDFGRPV